MNDSPSAISLFSSGGIGDLAVRAAGYRILVSNEREADRHSLFETNFPETESITGDIWTSWQEVRDRTLELLGGHSLGLLYATPPCQGMSKNGRGKLLQAVRSGNMPAQDVRNRLIIPTMWLAKALRPNLVVLENVSEMKDTIILDEDGQLMSIPDYVARELGADYVGGAEVVEFADYGVPQCRQRLISVYSRSPPMLEWYRHHRTYMPARTHSRDGAAGTAPWRTVRDTISDLPPLDAGDPKTAASDIPFHCVPLLDKMKHWWVHNTAPGASAFDNQCVECSFQGNPTHGNSRTADGINRASRDTPVHCLKCGELLPRPSVVQDGSRRIMRGFTSAYKRMDFDRPASALTRNLSYACSDKKLHPEQDRVLSLYEAFRLHTVDQFGYHWRRSDGRRLSNKTIREVIGESIPPVGLKLILDQLVAIDRGLQFEAGSKRVDHGPLFSWLK